MKISFIKSILVCGLSLISINSYSYAASGNNTKLSQNVCSKFTAAVNKVMKADISWTSNYIIDGPMMIHTQQEHEYQGKFADMKLSSVEYTKGDYLFSGDYDKFYEDSLNRLDYMIKSGSYPVTLNDHMDSGNTHLIILDQLSLGKRFVYIFTKVSNNKAVECDYNYIYKQRRIS